MKLYRLAIISLIIIAALIVTSGRKSSSAATLCVDPGGGGGCFTTIQAAINAAGPGDIINVAPGTYTENIILNKSVTLNGARAGVDARGRVVGAPNPAVESVITAASGTLLQLQTGSAGAVINGFAFSGGARGIESTSGPIDNLQILNNFIGGFTGNGTFLNDTGVDITVNQNEIDGTSKTGGGGLVHFDTDNFDGLRFTNNDVQNGATATGFFVDGNHNIGLSATRSPLIAGNLIIANVTGMNLGTRAFEFGEISGNTFRNSGFDGLQGGIQNTLITGNLFDNNGRSGLALTSFGNMGADRGGQNCMVTCNTFTANGFAQNGEGVFFSSTQLLGTISTNHVNNNNISGNNRGATYNGMEMIDMENNWWGSATGPTVASNPGGTGDIIGGTGAANIDFVPFQTALIPDTDGDGLLDPCEPCLGITCPSDITQSNDPNQCGAVVNYATPSGPGCGAINCSPASGSFFPVGTTTVNCMAAAGPTCNFTVTVNDTQTPSITCPNSVNTITPAPNQMGVIVTYTTPAPSDNCPGATVMCSPPSGSTFPVGTSTVTCTATDASGNTATCSFTVQAFDVCLQDDSSASRVLRFNSFTGDYIFCCGQFTLTGKGTVVKQGGYITLQHNTGDRRVLGKVSVSAKNGTASLQSPLGVTKCTILDRDIRNNACVCIAP